MLYSVNKKGSISPFTGFSKYKFLLSLITASRIYLFTPLDSHFEMENIWIPLLKLVICLNSVKVESLCTILLVPSKVLIANIVLFLSSYNGENSRRLCVNLSSSSFIKSYEYKSKYLEP